MSNKIYSYIFLLIFLFAIDFYLFFLSVPKSRALVAAERPVWARMYSWEKSEIGTSSDSYDAFWWAPTSGVPSTVSVDGYNRTDSRVAMGTTGVGVQYAIWSGHACSKGIPTSITATNLPTGTNYLNSWNCVTESRNGGAKVWCRSDNLSNVAIGGGDGCETYSWFGSNSQPNSDENNSGCVNSGSGSYYHFLCNFGAIISYVNPGTDMPDIGFSKRYTFNTHIYTTTNDPIRSHFAPPNSYYLYNMQVIYHTRHGGVSMVDQNTGYPAVTIAPDGYYGYVDYTSESRGTYVMARVRKELRGRVVGLNGTNSPVGLPNITVRIQGRDANTSNVVVGTTTTNSNGDYVFRGNSDLYTYYTIDVTSSAPAGYVGNAYAVKWDNFNAPMGTGISYTWRALSSPPIDIRDTRVGDTSYANQASYTRTDCTSEIPGAVPSSRCIFGFARDTTPPTTPTIDITSSPRCVLSVGNQFRWTASTDASGISQYNVYIYPSGGCTVGSGNNISCTSSYYIGTAAHSPVGGYIYFSSFNFQGYNAGYGTYNIMVQAVDMAGNKGSPGSSTLQTIGNVSNPYPMLTTTLLTYTGHSLSWLSAFGSSGYRVLRNGTTIATTSSAVRNYTDNYCNGSVSYQIQSYNQCSTANSEIDTVNCVPNSAPTCTIQYYNPTISSFINFSGSVTLNRNETRSLKANCSDGNGDSLPFYFWSSTCGTLGSGSITITNDNSFTSPNVNNTSCQVSVRTYDGYAYSNWSTGTFATVPSSNGTVALFTDTVPFTKTRITTSNNSFRVSNFESSSNATATISQSGLCSSSIASCTFDNSGTNTITVPPNASGTSIFNFTITIRNNPFYYNFGWNLPVIVYFSAGNQARSNYMSMSDSLPSADSISFSPLSPSSNSNITVSQSFSDDWSLKGYGVTAYDSVGVPHTVVSLSDSLAQRTVNISNANTNDTRSVSYNWNTSALPEGTYRLVTAVRDSLNQTWLFDNNHIPGYNSTYIIDRTAPICELISFPNGTSPSNISPLQISSRARDVSSNIVSARAIIVPSGQDRNILANRVFDSVQNISPVVPINTSYTTNPVFSWTTLNVSRGLYDVYIDWTDNAGNVTNTTASNQCRQSFELGSQFRSTVQIVSDDSDRYGFTRFQDNNSPFLIGIYKSGSWNTSSNWQQNDTNKDNCIARYPNGSTNDDHDNNSGSGACDDYILSQQVFATSETTNAAILIPKYNGIPKYKCDSILLNGISRTIQAGSYPLDPSNYDYCAIQGGFIPARGGALSGIPSVAYPSLVEFRLSYNTDGIVGRIFNKTGVSSTAYTIQKSNPTTGSNASYFVSSGNNYFVVPGSSDPTGIGNGWLDSVTSTGSLIISGSDISNSDCYYSFNNSPVYPNSPNGYLPNVGANDSTTFNSMRTLINSNSSQLTRVGDCSIINLDLGHGNFSPRYQNQIQIAVTPNLIIDSSPDNVVELSPNADACNPVTGSSINMPYETVLTLRAGGSVLETVTIQESDNGAFNFNTELDYNTTYSLCVDSVNNIVNLSNFGFCSGSGGGGTNCISFTPNLAVNVNPEFSDSNSFLVNFPNISTPATITVPIRMYLKESNNWWQVYNGGVHSNSELVLESNEMGSTEGMPSGAVMIGDPRPVPPGHNIPMGLDIYTQLSIPNPTYLGGLVSSYGVDPSSFNEFGIDEGVQNYNLGIVDFSSSNNKYLIFDQSIISIIQSAYNFASSPTETNGWSEGSSLDNTIGSAKKYYAYSGDLTYTNSGNPLLGISGASNVAVSVIDLSGGGSNIIESTNTLTIDTNIDLGVDEALVLYVNGNVNISPNVDILDSVFIVSTGNIIIQSEGEDLDTETLLIRGGLYADYVEFNRDLPDTIDPLDPTATIRPATAILFDNTVISNSHEEPLFPSEPKSSKIYWVIAE